MIGLASGTIINDADYPLHIYDVVGGKRKNVWRCPYYRAWKDMLKRCYSQKCLARQPTYAGCRAAPEWHRFSAFKEWMEGQDWEGKQLDKDILIPGNKLYSPGTCVFVSSRLNRFLNDNGSARGKHPMGVCWRKASGKFQAMCSDPFTGKQESLGYFETAEAAHHAWRQKKHELACQYADMQTDPRIASALRARFKPEILEI